MKRAILHGPRDFRVENVSDPKVDPDGVIIRVKACGICGSELPHYEGGLPSERVQERGLEAVSMSMMGHEWSGEVAEVGANVTDIKVGDRTTGMGYGAFVEYFPAKGIRPLPDSLSYEVGATIEPVGIGLNVAMNAEPVIGDTVVVIGAGMIGQGAWQIFRAMGAGKVIVIDVSKKRLEAAKALGADVVINAAEEDSVKKVLEVTSGLGADIVVDAAGFPTAIQQAIEMVRGGALYQRQVRGITAIVGQPIVPTGGKVIVVASYFDMAEIKVHPRLLLQKTLKLISCWGGWNGRGARALDLMLAGKVNTKPLITHEFSLDDINKAFETALNRDESIKVLVKP